MVLDYTICSGANRYFIYIVLTDDSHKIHSFQLTKIGSSNRTGRLRSKGL